MQDPLARHRACVLLKALLLDSEPLNEVVALQHAAVNYGVLLWQVRAFCLLPVVVVGMHTAS